MSALPRPDLPPGHHRDLVDALHDLHHHAGWPSLRTLARETGVSHTTVSKTFSSAALPTWGTLELVVEAMHGDTHHFHDLWLGATTPEGARPTTVRIAGRKTELAAVRHHLEGGDGLMLVTGEAGMGKTRLVTTAARTTDSFVATGHCLPLASEAPLMPIAELLRQVHTVDGGRWFDDGLAAASPFVPRALGRLLPELEDASDAIRESDGETSPQRLFAAVGTALAGLVSVRPLVLLLEDLHWADAATLDLLETLLARGAGLPILGTWRTEDQATPAPATEWLTRVRRVSAFHELTLSPLTKEETVEQLTLLIGAAPAPHLAESVYARSLGQPLFTEHLANTGSSGDVLPTVLADLLDTRMAGLGDTAWAIARVLAVADRPLSSRLLGLAVALPADQITGGLRELDQHRLLASTTTPDEAGLRHPLLAEAARRRLVPGEGPAVHRRLAELLGAEPDPSPVEIATHWQGADDGQRELEWRIAAARAAATRWASAQEAEQWLRALETWPSTCASAGEPPVSRPEAYVAAMEALLVSLQFDRAAAMSDEASALFPDVEPRIRAELLRRAAVFRGNREGYDVGLRLIDKAIGLYRAIPPSPGMIHALNHKQYFLTQSGRSDEAFSLAREAARAAESIGDASSHRHQLSWVAWHEGMTGPLEVAARTMARARALLPPGSDPPGDIREAMFWTDILLWCGGRSDEVEAAGREALALAADWEIENERTLNIRFNIALALIQDGDVSRAAAWVDPLTEGPVDLDRGMTHFLRALLDAIRGRLDAAESRASFLWRGWLPTVAFDLDYLFLYATIELWNNAPRRALDLLLPALDAAVDTALPVLVLPVLVLAAHAAADSVHPGTRDAVELGEALSDLRRRACPGFDSQPHNRAARSMVATWTAEMSRLNGTETVEHWVNAAGEWGAIGRPHDAAYCHWRGAEVALRIGQGTVAARLLKRAASDAGEHVPLNRAIAATAGGGGR